MDYRYIVVIGVSTGGPKALKALFSDIPKDLDATYVIVQHMPAGFIEPLARRLSQYSEITIKEAEDGEILKKGVAYLSPGGVHCRLVNKNAPTIKLSTEKPYKACRPSANLLFSSLANLDVSKKVISIVLTGMGSDGLEGINDLKNNIKDVTVVVENKESSIIYGMPKVISEANLHDYELHIKEISGLIKKLVR
ncbi:MAG: chemotaxis protein [Epulopiscium sp. Nele67-Bin004]|nr:MAG: chemotaxis protein [Epulopiscium sp. Nele67-Bin004]